MIWTIWTLKDLAASQGRLLPVLCLHLPLLRTSGRKTEDLLGETKMLIPSETSDCRCEFSCCRSKTLDKHNAERESKNCEIVAIEKETRWGLNVMFGEDQHAASDGLRRGQARVRVLGPFRDAGPATKEKERGR